MSIAKCTPQSHHVLRPLRHREDQGGESRIAEQLKKLARGGTRRQTGDMGGGGAVA